MSKLKTKEEMNFLIKETLDNLKEESDGYISHKKWYDTGIFAIILLVIGWIVYPFSIVGNQIIGVCLILMIVWFLYFFIFFSIPRSRSVFRTTKKHFNTFMKMSQKERDEIHNAVDRATPHLSKQGGTSSIMYFFVFGLFIILVVTPYLVDDITVNILTSHPLMTLIIFLVIVLHVGILIKFNRSMMGMHRYEKQFEKRAFTDEKTVNIIARFNLQRYGPWWFVIWGNIPNVLTIIFVVYIFIENLEFFDLPLNIVFGLVALQLITLALLRKRFSLISKISLGNQMQDNLRNLKQYIKQGKIRKIQRINDEYDKIMYKELTWVEKKS